MAELLDIYDFETAIPAGIKALFESEGIESVVTAADGPAFQKQRPRIELYFNTGAETGHHSPSLPYYRADAFNGSLLIVVISNTKSETVGTSEHMEHVAAVRSIMAKARTLFKADRDDGDTLGLMELHAIHEIMATGSNTDYQPEDGYYQTSLNYDIKFAIRSDAWPDES